MAVMRTVGEYTAYERQAIASDINVPVIAAGGIRTLADTRRLQGLGASAKGTYTRTSSAWYGCWVPTNPRRNRH